MSAPQPADAEFLSRTIYACRCALQFSGKRISLALCWLRSVLWLAAGFASDGSRGAT